MGGDMEGAKDVIFFTQGIIDRFRAIGTTAIIIDHQGKLQMGENYQSKTQYGNSYKKHLSRSVFQIEAREGDPDERRVTIRHKKTNFGPLMVPFGAKITFEHERITVEADELSQADLAEEATVNTSKRILIALENGPMFPSELQESLGVTLKTVKNRLFDLKKSGRVRETGVMSGQAQQVELVSVPGVPIPIRDSTGDTSTEVTTPTTEGSSPHTVDDPEVKYRASWLRKFLDLDEQTREVGVPVLHQELVNQQLILPSADPEPTARAANILIREGSIKGRLGYIRGHIHEIRRDNKGNISEDPEVWARILEESAESVYPATVELALVAGA